MKYNSNLDFFIKSEIYKYIDNINDFLIPSVRQRICLLDMRNL